MKRILSIASAALIALAALVSCSKYETVKGDPLATKIYTLDNGLQVYMTVNKEEPRIQTYIAVKVGSKNDPSETTGLAHYFEHLMFKGSTSFGTTDYAAEEPMLDEIERLFEVYRNTTDEKERLAIYHQIDSVSYEASKLAIPNEYDKLMSVIGAKGTNAWTSSDETVYTEDIPSNQIDNWARIQADRFRNNVIRGFHTELETVYEEKNMSLTQDSRRVWEAIDQALFPNHPYGKQTTLGTQEHLKNPSITNLKNYRSTYYVPNNIRICVSGDFNPDEMVAAIEKYFGDWEPTDGVPALEFEPEQPIVEPIVVDIYGQEAEMMAMAWRLPAAKDLESSAVATIAEAILSNGQAGLFDLDVNQQQKALGISSGCQLQPDYGSFLAMGMPKRGQALEELRDLVLEEVAKLRAGDFDEALIPATINNIKIQKMRQLESNRSRANLYVDAFINEIDWKDAAHEMDRLEAVTKEDVVRWANEYLGENSYAVIYKRMGVDNSAKKITAPKITPIVTNRDKQSDFLKEIQASEVKPIEPVFVDFSKDMSKFDLAEGVDVLYKQNTTNDIFTLNLIFNAGTETTPALDLATDYISYLGTCCMTAEEIASKMYSLACDFSVRASANQTSIRISGLSENMVEALQLVEEIIADAEGDDDILAALKADNLKARANAKTNQRTCFSALTSYVMYGKDFVKSHTLSDKQIAAFTSDELLGGLRDLYSKGHEILYYGPMKEAEVKDILTKNHVVAPDAQALPEVYPIAVTTPSSKVVIAPYDAKQIYYQQYSNRGESFDPAQTAFINAYNEYFGSGMNAIVFQEMREARGLAYSASARLSEPSFLGDSYKFTAFIATQNDKTRAAVEAFDDIINNMPQSEAAFRIAKESMESRIRTQRTTGMRVLDAYRQCRRKGLSEPADKANFEAIKTLTFEDVLATQQTWVKGRSYTYAILGDEKNLDMKYIRTLGPVERASLEDIFGY